MKALFTFIAIVVLTTLTFAQAPEAFNYSAVVRNGSGTPLPNQNVRFRLSILSGSVSGTNVYSETHATTTDANGMVNLEIGRGTIVSGNFSAISWSSNSYFLQVEVDPAGGTTFVLMGTTQFLSVPYALYAKYAGNTVPNTFTLDTLQSASFYDNHFFEVTKITFNDPRYYPYGAIADNYGNIISYSSSLDLTSQKINGTLNFRKSNFISNTYSISSLKVDHNGNIYICASGYCTDGTVAIDGIVFTPSNCDGSSIVFLAKFDKNGVIQWAKIFETGYLPYLDADTLGNSYILIKNKIEKYNTNGVLTNTINLTDSTYNTIEVNDIGGYVLSYPLANTNNTILKREAYNSSNVLKWSKEFTNITGVLLRTSYYENDDRLYLGDCLDRCFSIGDAQYCEGTENTDNYAYRLIGLNSSGNLDSYLRYKNTPSVRSCFDYYSSLFKLNDKISVVVRTSVNFYNNGTKYGPGSYLIKF